METNINPENQNDTAQIPMGPSVPDNPVNLECKKPNTMFFLVIGLLIINIFLIVYIVSTLGAYKSQVNNTISSLTLKVSTLENKLTDTNVKMDLYRNIIVYLSLNSKLTEGIVTDQLVVQRANFDDGVVYLDIRPQPSFSSHFLGQGRFDIPDRELKATILTLINETKSYYENYVSNIDMPSFDEYKIHITQNNYEVATYSGGQLKLIGEN